MRRVLLVAAAALLGVFVRASEAQVRPDVDWRTLRTRHFDVLFSAGLEEPARRAAANAEVAYAELSRVLVPPRGRVALVVADNVDFANGYATPFPSNRIVVYTSPPVSTPSLRFYDDWSALVVAHELVHIFHLDRARGWWRVGQRLLGRNPLLMPNVYLPSWVTEGLATYYESELTHAGRVRGSHQRMIVRSSVMEGGLPALDEWSLATSRYPGGEMAYAYGSLFFDYLARTRGAERLGRFVEQTSGQALPFQLNRAARESFGISFDAAWRGWRRALSDSVGQSRDPLPGWRQLTEAGRLAMHPRWLDSVSIVFVANTGRETPAAYRVGLDGSVDRVGRRNSVDANAPLSDGGLLFAQLEYLDPYTLRSDLFVQRAGTQRRLTRGARLGEPDVRADGAIVAVQATPAATRLVRVSADGMRITTLTPAALDTHWAEPRWSPRGDRIAATRWRRGGFADVVVLDTLGDLLAEITHDRAVDGTPSWSPDGKHLLFVSDRTGVFDLYFASSTCEQDRQACSPSELERAAEGAGSGAVAVRSGPRRLSRAATGLLAPELRRDGALFTAVHFRSDGWHVGVAPFDTAGAMPTELSPARISPPLPAPPRSDEPVRPYSPWRSLLPRYWMPLVAPAVGTAVGGLTSGSDLVGRHAYEADALIDTENGRVDAAVTYSYRGLGVPVLAMHLGQEWNERLAITDASDALLGVRSRRARAVSLTASVPRPRVRTSSFLALGVEMERWRYSTDPESLLARLRPEAREPREYRTLLTAVGWSNAQRPSLSISPEDGISLAIAARHRWLADEGVSSRSVSGTAAAYKSLPFPGYAHHVLAARLAAGYEDGDRPAGFSVGGVSGSVLSVVPGISLGGRRTFAVRGFEAGALVGTRVVSGSVEYRAPLAAPRRGLGLWPLFLDRASLSAFGDVAQVSSPPASTTHERIGSVGAELNLDAAFQYDIAYRLRLGVATPVAGRTAGRARAATVYVTAGLSF